MAEHRTRVINLSTRSQMWLSPASSHGVGRAEILLGDYGGDLASFPIQAMTYNSPVIDTVGGEDFLWLPGVTLDASA